MREDMTAQPKVHDQPEADDLKQIDGIGPGFEKRFHQAGILTYAQLARLTPEEITGILAGQAGFNPKRAITQDWIGQARHLADDMEKTSLVEEGVNAHERQHYASYKLEFLLHKDNQVRRTYVLNVGTHADDSWAGWNEARLRDFFIKSAGMRLPEPAISLAPASAAPASQPEQVPQVQPNVAHPGLKRHGVPLIRKVSLLSPIGQASGNMVASSKPFGICLDLDLSQVLVPAGAGEILGYRATLFVKQFGSRQRLPAGQGEGSLSPLESAQITLQGNPLAPGDYRLEALVAFWPLSLADHPENHQVAYIEGILVHAG
jgi:hypothetical protein